MTRYRHDLPQLGRRLFMTDGGLETTLIYHDGLDLPAFAAFDLLKDAAGVSVLRAYYETYAKMARSYDSAWCWRARPGARIPTGRRAWGTTMPASPMPIASRSSCARRFARSSRPLARTWSSAAISDRAGTVTSQLRA